MDEKLTLEQLESKLLIFCCFIIEIVGALLVRTLCTIKL